MALLLCACAKKPVYKQTFDRALAADPVEGKRFAQEAMQQAELAGAICRDEYDDIVQYLVQNSELSEADRESILRHSVDVIGQAECANKEDVLFRRSYLLGNYYYGKRRYADAELPLVTAVQIGMKLRGADDGEMAGIREDGGPHTPISYPKSIYEELAGSYEGQGKYAQAEPWRRKDVAMHEKHFGPFGDQARDLDQGGVRDQINALAKNLNLQGKTTEAEQLYLRSMNVAKHSLSANVLKQKPLSFFCAVENAGLAEVYRQQRKYKESDESFRTAIDALEASGPMIHPPQYLAEVRLNYAKLLRETGRATKAKELEDSVEKEKMLGTQIQAR
jgi:tetratricopeptide (TPR) repeat protein